MAMVRYSNDFWVKHVSACAASGLRSKAYAEQHGLSLNGASHFNGEPTPRKIGYVALQMQLD
jgi:hypothetical protein